MLSINPYLNFNGTTEDAFNHYKSVFGGEFAMVQRFSDTPDASKMSADDAKKIMHISLPIGNGNVLMGSDVLPSLGHPEAKGNNFYLSINTQSQHEADDVFQKLSDGGMVEMPMQNTFWGSYFGMLTDRFGIHWMISFENKKP